MKTRPPEDKNFCYIFELPEKYPEGFCFGGGRPVNFQMVDWFQPWPSKMIEDIHGIRPKDWDEVVQEIIPWLQMKNYVKPGRQYLMITLFDESLLFSAPV